MKLEVKNISKCFESGKKAVQALDGVSFEINSGEIFGFVGANGAGKSTTMRIIMGVLSLDNGEVLVDGKQISQEDRQAIGYMPSERGLYPKMKVNQQLQFFGEIHGLSPKEAKEQADFWIDKLSVREYAEKTLTTLSTGNQQRVQLAAALVGKPKMLILDEPFSGLDPLAVKVMSGVIKEFANQGMPVLFSSHQLELIDELADKVGIIQKGKMVADGTPDELRKQAHAPAKIEIPTPLANIFGDLIKEGE
ncbi:MAG: ATP-binding cassette domain-containing protein [Candidatus Ancillula sp.]|jgi:ABC-2 type transport system ATP-binding protein|nr:ATP-binding cassette domain-containing protein [Candidatus Ancillula sp.]